MSTQDMVLEDRMIITAASAAFGPSLLALLGSLDCNWPGHPRVRVYDIGLDAGTLATLQKHQIEVVPVPPFCAHWRKHFTWKIWCWNDVPARDVLWMDSGMAVLQPMDELFEAIDRLSYFVVPTYHLLTENASLNACRSCGVSPSFRDGKMTLAGTFIGFRKEGKMKAILAEALAIANVEENIASVEKMHRHDQMIISLLLYKHFEHVVMLDGMVYCGWLSPQQVTGQKIWVHRRALAAVDQAYYASRITSVGQPHLPVPPEIPNPFKAGLKAAISAPERALRKWVKRQRQGKEKPYDGIRDKS
ncbi:MAG: hypothetical protein HY306_01295 [Nitrosomonadales bacterium]|nr:hypothetical protein [Nitrosomonadales bacterium]